MRRLKMISCCAALVFAPALLTANTVSISTAPGSTSAGGAVDATAVITTGAGTVTIDLTNNLSAAAVKNVGQNLSDLFFSLDNTATSGSVSSSTGTFVDVASDGSVSAGTSQSGSATDLIAWSLENTGPGSFHLNGLNGPLLQTIIGGAGAASYPNANASIAGNGPHNPFVQGTGHFVLSIAGVTAATNISNVIFSFGTTSGDNVSGVPEPRFYSLLLFAGIIGAAILHRRRSRAA